ncbi:thioredoxin domain-containing protein [Variovorax sp. J2P1-59]|uniref:thioredoxin domain-containing protein n=1 Tax=Variovorax flavidus TaxID=3053501 RepID=UPI002575DEBB|nr:thioredoxin domain-containing protein [Variovorax sp. J2P1-59]MDM0078166.1 thioredoxin domain-containing protein [Variovorax sp. J2P1-59]
MNAAGMETSPSRFSFESALTGQAPMKQKHRDRKSANNPTQPIISLLHKPLMPARAPVVIPGVTPGVFELTRHNYESAIEGWSLAVVDFWAPSSPFCRAFAPVFAAASARHAGVLFAKVNVEEQPEIGSRFNITSIPTLMIVRDGIIVHVHEGPLQAGELDVALNAARTLDLGQMRRQMTEATGGGAETDAGLPSLESYLRPSVRIALPDIAPRLAAGRLVLIRDAFEADFAERMHRSLDNSTAWRVQEGYETHFHYHYHDLSDAERYPEDIAECSRIFDSPKTKEWMTRLSGRSCTGPTEFFANWYLPGDYLHPHNDVAANDANSHRQVTFVWYLAKEWRSEWGGSFYWCPTNSYLPASFNTLALFNVGPEGAHLVSHVSPFAKGKRLAISGWWTGQAATPALAGTRPEQIRAGDAEFEIY